MITYLIVFITILLLIDRFQNKNYFFKTLNIFSFWIYVLVHEIGHGISSYIFGKGINKIKMSFTVGEIERTGTLGYCSYFHNGGRLSQSIIAYSGELFTIIIGLVGGYLYGIGKIEFLFYIFSFFFLIYFIYGEKLIDKIVGFFLFLLFLSIDNEFIRNNDFGVFDFIDKMNLPLIKEIICFSLLGFIIGGTIVNIFKLKGHVGNLYESMNDGTKSSDAGRIKELIGIPQFVTYGSWMILLIFVLVLNYSMMFGKNTGIEYIDNKVEYIEKLIKFERNTEKIKEYENKNILNEIKKTGLFNFKSFFLA